MACGVFRYYSADRSLQTVESLSWAHGGVFQHLIDDGQR